VGDGTASEPPDETTLRFMTQPTPRTDTKTDQASNTPDGIRAETEYFATAGDLTVTVTNNHDEPAEVYLEEAPYTAETGPATSTSIHDYFNAIPPRVTVAANGGTATFDRDVLGRVGDRTFYRVAAEFDAEPSGTGEISAEFEQLNEKRGVDVDSL
jgi:hypothetical protein